MLKSTEEILSMAEEVSGYPVHVESDSTIGVSATVKMAQKGLNSSIIRFNPEMTPRGPDYVVAYECGCIIRTFKCLPEERYQFGSTDSGREEAEKLFQKTPLAKQPELIPKVRDQLFDGLMTQLRSVPVGMRIEHWIRNKYPDLHDLQELEVRRELEESSKSLAKNIREMFPAKIYNANIAMNAAYAEFWAQILNEPPIRVPYKTTRYYNKGMKLLRIWNDSPTEPTFDRQIIDDWGNELGIQEWYRWIPLN